MGTNQMKTPRAIGERFYVIGTIVSHRYCGVFGDHEGHWYPTGDTNDKYEVLINACPGLTTANQHMVWRREDRMEYPCTCKINGDHE